MECLPMEDDETRNNKIQLWLGKMNETELKMIYLHRTDTHFVKHDTATLDVITPSCKTWYSYIGRHYTFKPTQNYSYSIQMLENPLLHFHLIYVLLVSVKMLALTNYMRNVLTRWVVCAALCCSLLPSLVYIC